MSHLGLLVDPSSAKRTKTACENAQIFDRLYGARKSSKNDGIIIGTSLKTHTKEDSVIHEESVEWFLKELSKQKSSSALSFFSEEILKNLKGVVLLDYQSANEAKSITKNQRSPFEVALDSIPLDPTLRSECISLIPRFESYADFTLIQKTILEPPWSDLLSSPHSRELLSHLSTLMKTSHLAAKVSIPRNDPVRRPIIKVLLGDFGDFETVQFPPLQQDFDSVFWTNASLPMKKEPIKYIWSPMFTMYSKGNTSEKRRIAHLQNVSNATVVDLYAGIGYFVFAYLYAGAKRVFACEINPWSIEGLRRGAEANGFTHETKQLSQLKSDTKDEYKNTSSQVTIFPFSNAVAASYLKSASAQHVNLGLLPDARLGIPIAVDALSPQGGWLHIHEEVQLRGDKGSRNQPKQEWAELMQSLVLKECNRRWLSSSGLEYSINVKSRWIEEVKTLGKNLWHLVADVEVVVS